MTPTTLILASSQKKSRLLGSCAVIGFTLALSLASAAQAQWAAGFEPGVPPAGANVSSFGTSTTVSVSNSETIIRWLPTDGAPTGGSIDLLPSDSSLTFFGIGDYTVLNQIVDNNGGAMQRLVELNGTINSFDSSTPSGNIWFQNAGGILVGQSGVINVGSLILTSNAISTNGATIGFTGTANSGTVTNLGNITAQGGSGSNYVALVAPRIVQSGTVQANGSIAYIAAEAANLTINNGLFDIELLVGADGGNVLNHAGTSETMADASNQNIYMAALAKNDAISMLVGGTIGYAASTASVNSFGSIILSSGYNINNGAIAGGAGAVGSGDIQLSASRYNGAVTGQATGAISADIAAGTNVAFTDGAALTGDTSVIFNVAGNLTASYNMDLLGSDYVAFDLQSGGRNGAAGLVRLNIDGGNAQIVSNATLSANALTDPLTGNAQGGTVELTVQNGGILDNEPFTLSLSANALGGSSQMAGAAGGFGRGGTVTVSVGDGSFNTSQVSIDVSGAGGIGQGTQVSGTAGGDGGAGQGGDVTISFANEAAISPANFNVIADGTGGNGGGFFAMGPDVGATGNGGNGTGGTISFADDRNSDAGLSLLLDASGRGGSGGNLEGGDFSTPPPPTIGGSGGLGQGGSVSVLLSATYDDASLNMIAAGSGGEGGLNLTGGAGGAGIGGDATLTANNNGPNLITASWDVAGNGGNGRTGRYGNGGNGGAGTGGTASLVAQGTDADFIFFPTQMITTGTGGIGGDGGNNFGSLPSPSDLTGGNGGAGTGGTLRFVSTLGAQLTIGSFGSPGPVLTSQGFGGGGGSAPDGTAGNGGNGAGGSVSLMATGGTIQQGDQLTIATDTIGGSGGLGLNGEGISGSTTGGTIRLESADVGTDQGRILLAGGDLSANGDRAGRIVVHASDGGEITTDALNINALGEADPTNNNSLSANSGVILQADAGTINSNGAINVNSGGSIGVHASGTGSIAAATGIFLLAGDQVEIRHANRPANGATLASAANINIAAGNSVFADAGSLIRSVEGFNIETSGNVDVGTVETGDGPGIIVSGDGAVSIDNLQSTGALTLSGTSVTVDQGGDLFFASLNTSDGDANITTGGTLTIESGTITGDANFNSADDMEIINLGAIGSINAASGQTLAVSGFVEAPDITLTSRDINFGSGAYLGSFSGDSDITLINSDATRQTFIGGTNPQNGYHLDSLEMQALFGTTVRIVAPNVAGNAVPDMVVGDFSLDMETRGSAFALQLETAGRIQVNGTAQFTYAFGDHRLGLTAGEGIDVIMGQGALRISDPGNAPGGTLALNAPRIMVATEAAFADLAGATTVEAYETRLAQNDGFAAADANLSAGTIDATVQTGFFVQNNADSSAIDARRGISFGSGGLNITTSSSANGVSNAMLVLNGVQETPNGMLTGSAAIAGITINGGPPASASFNRQSLMNSCLITNPAVCGADALTPVVPVVPIIPIQDVIDNSAPEDEEEITANERETTGMPDMLISMRDLDPLSGEPLVDDPVTGAGNDDLWGPVTN